MACNSLKDMALKDKSIRDQILSKINEDRGYHLVRYKGQCIGVHIIFTQEEQFYLDYGYLESLPILYGANKKTVCWGLMSSCGPE